MAVTDIDEQWLAKIKRTMAIDVGRGIASGKTGEQIVAMLFDIPEVDQAMRMRAKGRPKD